LTKLSKIEHKLASEIYLLREDAIVICFDLCEFQTIGAMAAALERVVLVHMGEKEEKEKRERVKGVTHSIK